MPEALQPPREMNKVSLPAYRIEPPDVIQIEMLKLIPLPPYRAEIFDVLQIRANALPDQPIDNYYMVEAEGTINLGPVYGSVRVTGMTIDEIKATLNKWLHQWLREPSVSVQLARVSGAQPVTGQYLVYSDGTINLRQYGVVHIAGMTVTEAKIAIQNHLKQFLDSPELSVDVVGYRSKVYYIIVQGAGLGDTVRSVPITGNETVLDAMARLVACRRFPARRSGLPGRRRTISAASRSCPSNGTPSPKGRRRRRITRFCLATGCMWPRTK